MPWRRPLPGGATGTMIPSPQPGPSLPAMEHPVKYLAATAGALLGALFIMAALTVLLHLAKEPTMEPGTLKALFMGAFGPSGYLTMVKVLELIGGVLVALPMTRRL